MNFPWWYGLSPAEMTIRCSDMTHRLRWSAGELSATDHPKDTGELAPGASGRGYPCLDIVHAWQRHADDLQVLVLGSRGAMDPLAGQDVIQARFSPAALRVYRPQRQVARDPAARPLGTSGMSASVSSSNYPAVRPRALALLHELVSLFALSPALQNRLAATVAAAWTQRICSPQDGERVRQASPTLEAALYGRVTAALRTWNQLPGLRVELRMLGEGERPGLARSGSGIAAALPLSWLLDVWAKDLTTVGGRFCLAAAPAGLNTWLLSTMDLSFGPLREVTVELPPSG